MLPSYVKRKACDNPKKFEVILQKKKFYIKIPFMPWMNFLNYKKKLIPYMIWIDI